jgi:hypothetical protein
MAEATTDRGPHYMCGSEMSFAFLKPIQIHGEQDDESEVVVGRADRHGRAGCARDGA